MYKEYFKNLEKVGIGDEVTVLNDDALKKVAEDAGTFGFMISPDFKTPIFINTGWTYVSPEYLKDKYPLIKKLMDNKVGQNAEKINRLNYYGSHNFYSNKDNFNDDYDGNNIVITVPDNLSKYDLPKNLDPKTKEQLNDYYKDGRFIFRGGSVLEVEIEPATEDMISGLGLKDIAGCYTFRNSPDVVPLLAGGLIDEIATGTILKYNHEAKYVLNNKLKFGEKKYKEGTSNVVLGSPEFLGLKNELSKIDKNSEEYKECEKYLKDYTLKNETSIKNTLSFLNSDKWSATPLTYEIGNVDKKSEEIAYKTIEKEDPNMLEGERKVIKVGKNGEKLTVTTYEVDEKTGELKNPKTEETITDAVDEVVLVGTKKKDEGTPLIPLEPSEEITPDNEDDKVEEKPEEKVEEKSEEITEETTEEKVEEKTEEPEKELPEHSEPTPAVEPVPNYHLESAPEVLKILDNGQVKVTLKTSANDGTTQKKALGFGAFVSSIFGIFAIFKKKYW